MVERAVTLGVAMRLPPAITSRTNARVKALRASFSGKASRPGELVGIEGENLIGEALRSGLGFETVFVREGSEAVLQQLASLAAEECVVLSRDVFASAVDTASPQGIAAMVVIPAEKPLVSLQDAGPVLVLEALQDPGNVGTLLRSAEAFGVPFVLMTQDCVNPWNPKVVRASAGSVFRIPVLRSSLAGVRESLPVGECTIYAAVAPHAGARSLLDTVFAGSSAVMIGNEGAGLSAEALAIADVLVTIPCAVESLNAAVAGSTLLYEAMRQREGAR